MKLKILKNDLIEENKNKTIAIKSSTIKQIDDIKKNKPNKQQTKEKSHRRKNN